MYPFVNEPWKTAEKVRFVLDEFYSDRPDGLIGNEDCGQMSAWYILSVLGMYQVEPAGGKYVFGTPSIDKATLNVGNGKTFTITSVNNSKENLYVCDNKTHIHLHRQLERLAASLIEDGIIVFEDGEYRWCE